MPAPSNASRSSGRIGLEHTDHPDLPPRLRAMIPPHIIERMLTVGRLAPNLWRTLRSPLPAPLKRRIALTDARLRALAGFGQLRPNRPIDMLGYVVRPFAVDSFLYLFREIFVGLEYYFEPTTEAPLILDCGSNIGISVLFFKAMYPDCKVLAFEPEPTTFARLEEHTEGNRLTDVQLHQVALGPEDGHTTFYRDPSEPGSPKASVDVRRVEGGQPERVALARLSTFVDRDVSLLKLDVEGAELDVLRELAASGKIARVDQMVIECHHHIDPDLDAVSHVLALLEDSGFGYQLAASCFPVWRSQRGRAAQDVLIYAYRK